MAERKTDWSDQVAHVFPPGTQVEAHPRLSDSLDGPPVTKPVATAKVDGGGVASLSGLEPHGPYWLVGRPLETVPDGEPQKRLRRLAFTANDERDIPEPSERVTQRETVIQTKREADARARLFERTPEAANPTASVTPDVITGPRNTVNTHMDKGPGAHDPKVDEPQPHPKQEDIPASTPQRSATPAGQGTPVEPGELQPKPSQSDVKKGTPQRSSTPLGEATPKPPDEQVPQARQEDSQGKRQRSDTKHGSQAPKPATKSPKQQEKARESSESKAAGSGTTAVAGTAKRKRASTAGKARKATNVVKPASKRQARKQDKA